MSGRTDDTSEGPLLVISAHAGDFVWRAGGAIALAGARDATAGAYMRLYPQVTTALAG